MVTGCNAMVGTTVTGISVGIAVALAVGTIVTGTFVCVGINAGVGWFAPGQYQDKDREEWEGFNFHWTALFLL